MISHEQSVADVIFAALAAVKEAKGRTRQMGLCNRPPYRYLELTSRHREGNYHVRNTDEA
ncbi:MAG: hypothetical protein ACJ789_02100 [Thermomicrobiales bacterium]